MTKADRWFIRYCAVVFVVAAATLWYVTAYKDKREAQYWENHPSGVRRMRVGNGWIVRLGGRITYAPDKSGEWK